MSRNRNTFRHRNVLRYVTAIPIPYALFKSERNPAKRIREEEEGQRSDTELPRTAEGCFAKAERAQFAPMIRGCTGFDGGMEAGQAGGGA